MNIRDHSSKFTIYVFTPEVDRGAGIKVSLSQAGYDCFYFQDAEILEARLAEAVPHILLFSTEGLEGSLNDFVEYVRNFSENIKFIIIGENKQFEILSQYNAFGLEEILDTQGEAIEARAVWAVDRVCEKAYLTFQNEQLFDSWKEAQASARKAEKEISQLSVPVVDFAAKIADYKSGQSREEVIQKFLNRLTLPTLYFKFLPSVGSFVATHAHIFSPESLKAAGGQMNKDEIKSLDSQLAFGNLPPVLAELVKNNFNMPSARVLPLYVHKHLEGFVVYSRDVDPIESLRLQEEFAVFNLCYSHLALEQKVDSLEVLDFVTELYNRSYFQKTLQTETERASRLRLPVSVVKIAIDDFYELEQSQGEVIRDSILKAVGEVITKTSRANDINCRTQVNEFALILPHCSRKGAALRAERLRRAIEGAHLLDGPLKISVSLGISEYPSLCNSSATLNDTSSKALGFIIDKGGNKICMYKASENHKPEFEVAAE